MKKYIVTEVIYTLGEITEESKSFDSIANAKFDFNKRVDLYKGSFNKEVITSDLSTFYNDSKCFVIISLTECNS
jgi:hypothetical protein